MVEESRWQYQTVFGEPEGDCWTACVASIMDWPLGALPNFCAPDVTDWFSSAVDWFKDNNLLLDWWTASHGDIPKGLAIAGGMSIRGLSHANVYLDGNPWFDPHPDNMGLVSIEDWFIIRQEGGPSLW